MTWNILEMMAGDQALGENDNMHQVEFVDGERRVSFKSNSAVLRSDGIHEAANIHVISAKTAESYGKIDAEITIRIGNGGLGPTGILRALCLQYLKSQSQHGESFGQSSKVKFEWIANHSRYTQIALQAGVVDVALTYEHEEEARTEKEGWSSTEGVLCHDHFILAGPKSDPAGLGRLATSSISQHSKVLPVVLAFKAIADSNSTFHTRGDGSATMHKEHNLWKAAGVNIKEQTWYQTLHGTPMEALRRADKEGAYLLIDRATFLFALHKNEVHHTNVFLEGGAVLLNTCSILLRSDEQRDYVHRFAKWLQQEDSQRLLSEYGRDWEAKLPLVTPRSQEEVSSNDELRFLAECKPTKILEDELEELVV